MTGKILFKKEHILDHSPEELEMVFEENSWDRFRLRQVCGWIFSKRSDSFDVMSDLPQPLRNSLSEKYSLRSLQVSRMDRSREDRTEKFTFVTEQNRSISCVLLPRKKYDSLCISTQVGCAWGCRFCASGLVRFQRNLTSGEILDQIFISESKRTRKIHNILFMGMGEPLANYHGTVRAILWMTSPAGFNMSPGRITLSTTGLVPQLKKFARERLQVNLALSLHAPTDELRMRIMPKSSRFTIQECFESCKDYQTLNNGDFTIEYILLKDVNDSPKDAQRLVRLVRSSRFLREPKINLIPYNPVSSLPFQTSPPGKVNSFFETLRSQQINVHTRRPQGQDIESACGQLL